MYVCKHLYGLAFMSIMHIKSDSLSLKATLSTLRGTDTLSGWAVTLLNNFCLPSENESTSKRKEFVPKASKFFPFKVDPFQRGLSM